MAFLKINEGEVQSDSGFRIRIGHSRLTYMGTGGTVQLDAEHMADGVLVIYGFLPDCSIDPVQRALVLRDVREALSFMKVPFEVEEEP